MTYDEARALVSDYGARSWVFDGWVFDIKWGTLRKKILTTVGARVAPGLLFSEWDEHGRRIIFKRLSDGNVMAVEVSK